ncbi:MAG: ATP-binding protein [Spirochaetes bacterium]|nr:ATP-binding protein [Spirochaetota bacterium]
MAEQNKEIHFLDSFKVDTTIIREVIDKLMVDLKRCEYAKEEIDEIILAMDEAITNAIQETLFTQKNCVPQNKQTHEITIRYHVSCDEFDATVIDHGKGLDIEQMLKSTPDRESANYKQQLFDYAKKSESTKLKVRLNGKEISLNGIGAGLRIILSFMDKLNIDLIDKESVLSTNVCKSTDGSILNMQRKRRYQ